FARQQIEEQRAQTGFEDDTRHASIARAVTAAPAAVREEDHSAGAARNHQVAVKYCVAGRDPRLNFQQIRILIPHHSSKKQARSHTKNHEGKDKVFMPLRVTSWMHMTDN